MVLGPADLGEGLCWGSCLPVGVQAPALRGPRCGEGAGMVAARCQIDIIPGGRPADRVVVVASPAGNLAAVRERAAEIVAGSGAHKGAGWGGGLSACVQAPALNLLTVIDAAVVKLSSGDHPGHV